MPGLADLAQLALGCVQREFPCNPAHVLREAGEAAPTRALHPAFYGCFDWHSAVHAHWLLAHALRREPRAACARAIQGVLDEHLTPEKLGAEARYLAERPYFERPYGWAWLLKLATELIGWEQAATWRAALEPLVLVVEQNYLGWLPRQRYPIRAGVHTNSAFGLTFALDYARQANRAELEHAATKQARAWFANDRSYPAGWEPGGNDFLSPCLVEASLMLRVLPDFAAWFSAYLPEIPGALLTPATAGDRSDGQLAHLDGLNLSRAWCYYELARALGENDLLLRAAAAHHEAGLGGLHSGHYAGEHWLASFAAYAAACAFDGATTTPAARNAAT